MGCAHRSPVVSTWPESLAAQVSGSAQCAATLSWGGQREDRPGGAAARSPRSCRACPVGTRVAAGSVTRRRCRHHPRTDGPRRFGVAAQPGRVTVSPGVAVAPRAGAVGDCPAGAVVGAVQHPALTVQLHCLRPAHMPAIRDRHDIPRHAAAVPDIRVAGFPGPPAPFPCADTDRSEHCAPSRAAGLDALRVCYGLSGPTVSSLRRGRRERRCATRRRPAPCPARG